MANISLHPEIRILIWQTYTNWQVGYGSYSPGVAYTHLCGPFTSLMLLIHSEGVRTSLLC